MRALTFSPHAAAAAACPAAPGLLKAFRGHLGELLRHPAGNHVVDDLWAGGRAFAFAV